MWSVAFFPSERVAQCILECETISVVDIKLISLGEKKRIFFFDFNRCFLALTILVWIHTQQSNKPQKCTTILNYLMSSYFRSDL